MSRALGNPNFRHGNDSYAKLTNKNNLGVAMPKVLFQSFIVAWQKMRSEKFTDWGTEKGKPSSIEK